LQEAPSDGQKVWDSGLALSAWLHRKITMRQTGADGSDRKTPLGDGTADGLVDQIISSLCRDTSDVGEDAALDILEIGMSTLASPPSRADHPVC
jgi:hypothetical protein